MDIKIAIEKYIKLGEFFSPDYNSNNKVLKEFKKDSKELSLEQCAELASILRIEKDMDKKFFVADLLYLYNEFHKSLFDPLIDCAINFRDASFNRIFLKPCLRAFGAKKVAKKLTEKFVSGSSADKCGIALLIYWLPKKDNMNADILRETIINRSKENSNPVEHYYYTIAYSEDFKQPNGEVLPDKVEFLKSVNNDPELQERECNRFCVNGNLVSIE